MLISQPALMCLAAAWQRATGQVNFDAALTKPRLPDIRKSEPTAMAGAAPSFAVGLGMAEPITASDVEQAPMVTERGEPGAPLTANERRARAAALRALSLSRGRQFNAARLAFIEASRLDPSLDLTRTPSFWSLERAAHEAAIDAYAETGRDGDAAVLRARVRSTYRPKPLRPRVGAPLIT